MRALRGEFLTVHYAGRLGQHAGRRMHCASGKRTPASCRWQEARCPGITSRKAKIDNLEFLYR